MRQPSFDLQGHRAREERARTVRSRPWKSQGPDAPRRRVTAGAAAVVVVVVVVVAVVASVVAGSAAVEVAAEGVAVVGAALVSPSGDPSPSMLFENAVDAMSPLLLYLTRPLPWSTVVVMEGVAPVVQVVAHVHPFWICSTACLASA